jgi:prophage antirepressor-like protein
MSKKEQNSKIAIFQSKEVRKVFFDGEWFFSIEDIIMVLTDSVDPKGYIKDLRRRDEEVSKGWGQIATPLPIITAGGRQNVNCANTEAIFRLIQSIPSKKAEPFKRWLARVGKERLDEIEQPAKAIERAKNYYAAKGYSKQWIETRTASIDTRHKFTDTLKDHGITEHREYGILTDELYSSSFSLSTAEYKEHKGLSKKDSLRDNMTPLELAAVIFSEATSTEIITQNKTDGFVETKRAIHIAGNITKEAIDKIEAETGKKVVTHKNYKELDSPEIRNELAQQSLQDKALPEEPLSDFNQKLKVAIENKPKKKD